ncbi:hypothetical protein J2T07_002724 [Luteibacter jiangsuensis]|uniref:YdaS antitoxin of YdaST toxin-antitoxin system n=1 Tax=Luteibacter jiangsuensis TaxID=637577 RepID=A0ABT9SZU5_9GAMM|nr:hypothetical protein [Luteibacter jiangsuensis]MDQ0010534.1 hypothetical protein [Luteibacter jiangsuensis]
MTSISEIRRANLATVLRELEADGVSSLREQADILGTSERMVEAILKGNPMDDSLAREIEWSAHKPIYWVDEDHQADLP